MWRVLSRQTPGYVGTISRAVMQALLEITVFGMQKASMFVSWTMMIFCMLKRRSNLKKWLKGRWMFAPLR
jgi:hypothetical protein